MFFKRKGYLRKQYDLEIIQHIQSTKQELEKQSNLLERSFEPPEQLFYEKKALEIKYFYLLKEAKSRKVKMI